MNENYNHAKMTLSVSAGTAGAVFSSIFGAWNDDIYALIILMELEQEIVENGLIHKVKQRVMLNL